MTTLRSLALVGIAWLIAPCTAFASNFSFSVADINTFVANSRTNGDRISELIGDEIQTRLGNEGIVLSEGGLLFRLPIEDDTGGGCALRYSTSQFTATVLLTPQSEFKLVLDALAEPIVATLDLVGTVDANGLLTLKLGKRVLGRCIRYMTDHIGVSVRADFIITVSLVVDLNPSMTTLGNGDIQISIAPEVDLYGRVKNISNTNVNLTDVDLLGLPLVRGILVEPVEALIEEWADSSQFGEEWADDKLQDNLADVQADLEAKLAELPTSFTIPSSDAEVVSKIFSFVQSLPTVVPITYEYLSAHRDDVLFALLIGNQDALRTLIVTGAACQVLNAGSESMPTTSTPGDFTATSWATYCTQITSNYMGDADAWDGTNPLIDQTPWTLYPPTTLDIGAVDIAGNHQPYMKRVKYKSVAVTNGTGQYCYNAYPYWQGCVPYAIPRGNGTCKLEMRVYKKDVAASNLKPLLAIHGGSWKYRGAAFIAMESQISQFTERGFVVFAPFYRLIDNSDGNVECNGASRTDIVADVRDALSWVENNMASYGASGLVHVMGQSAGAHLATTLAVTEYQRIARALLFYPPLDLQDFIYEYQNGAAVDRNGVTALETFFADRLGVDGTLRDLSIYDTAVVANSFPPVVQSAPTVYPPMFMLHGRVDTLVPSRQSVRMCNALSGNAASGPASDNGGTPANGSYRMVYKCDNRGSWLDLVAEGQHGLDVCIPSISCPAGSPRSVTEVTASLKDAYTWLNGNITRIEGPHPNYAWLVPILSLLL